MTQVKDMIDEKLDFALAEQLGWVNAWDGVRLVWLDGKTNEFRRKVTDWHPSTDPAASLEVQAKAIADNKLIYLNALLSLVSPGEDIQFGLGGSMEVVGYNIDGTSAMVNASPRERAEAAYITLQGERT
ncbi:hypothetical protein [Paenibacillus odorifer]|uniref:hypothetical protein n=1 Tax=Paenibacillus odorifer TaxID=189426 RepID=UPI00096EE9B5|nr:hypothetical protein [Paenibacillus odorifer]OMD92732.1 hypothetical protein BSK67_18385 [Paenibacillus odorifer]